MTTAELGASLMRFAKSIATSRDNDDLDGALVLFYAYCDAVGSLIRPIERNRTDSGFFKEFVRDYILPHCDSDICADDLWSTRCGILHTYSPHSGASDKKDPTVREIVYVGSRKQADFCHEVMKSDNQSDLIFIDPYDLFNGFIDGIVSFLKAVDQEIDLRERVLFHAEKYFNNYRIKLPQQDDGGNG
jgi:hypothetical protein